MANSKVYNVDPNLFLPTAEAGAAQTPASRTDGFWAKLFRRANGCAGAGYEIVDTTATALALDVLESRLTVSSTMAFTLAAPTYAGQRKTVRCISAASTPAATLTVSSPDDTTGFVCPATFFYDNVGQSITFEATPALKWRCIEKIRTGVKTLVVGTTVTTSICDMSHVDLSVTATVSSTTTKALPNGAAVGEICAITVSTAASTPHGTLGGSFAKKDHTAGTTLGTFDAATDMALLQWDGTYWKPLMLTGTTVVVA